MAFAQYYSDLKVSPLCDVEAARPITSLPSNLNAQAHFMYFDPVADKEEDEELLLGGNRKGSSCLGSFNRSCLCFSKPCGILGTLIFSAIVTFVLFTFSTSGNAPLKSDVGSKFDAPNLLGCENASHFFQNVTKVTYPIPLDDARKLSLRMMGDAVGTITIVVDERPAASPDVALIELAVRTSDESYLDAVTVHEDMKKGNVWRLFTPESLDSTDIDEDGQTDGACMRYDVVLHVPAGLQKLNIVSHTVTQVRVSEPKSLSQRMLSSLYLSIRSRSPSNLFSSSHSALAAHRMAVQMSGGEITGSVALGAFLQLDTQQGSVKTDLDVIQLSSSLDSAPAALRTIGGPGSISLRVVRPSGASSSYSRISAELHARSKLSHTFLDFTKAAFTGTVDLEGAYAGEVNDVDFYKLTDADAFSNAGVSTTGEDRLVMTSVDSTWMELRV